jgi:LysM repeat protein
LKPKPANGPLQVEPIDKEMPVEEKMTPDLSKLPKVVDSTPIETMPPVSNQTTAKPVDCINIKVKLKAGETIGSLAKKYGIAVENILAENRLKSGAEKIATGTEIVLPIPKDHFYKIKPKETLWRIAKRYGTTVEALMEINNIKDHTKIETGQAIILPVPVDKIANSKF